MSCVSHEFASVHLLSPAGKELTSWLLFVMFNCVFVTFPCGSLGQVWYLSVSISDLCRLSYFVSSFSYIFEGGCLCFTQRLPMVYGCH